MYDLLIIDGNNLLYSDPELARVRRHNFAQARQELVDKIDDAAVRLAEQIILIFDGTIGGKGREFRSSQIDILFSPAHQSADTLIERLVYEHGPARKVTVVTSDLAERNTVEGAGAEAMSCRLFLDEIEDLNQDRDRDIRNMPFKQQPPSLGDFFPDL